MDREIIKDEVIRFLGHIQMEYRSIEVSKKLDKIFVQIIPDAQEASLYIGYRGGNLHATEHILKSILWSKNLLPKDIFLSVDIDHYKEKNEEKILSIVEDKVAAVESTGIAQTMPFLNPADRRMVHMVVSEKYGKTVETESFTDEKGKRTLKILKKIQN